MAYRLNRSDIRMEKDAPTRSMILRYVGPTLDFDEYIYGYPDGTFFAVQLDEIPWPETLEDLADDLGVAIDPLPDAKRLRDVIADALAAGALVDAPAFMDEIGVDRDVEWAPWDLRDAERKHRIAEARVVEVTRLVANDMKLRSAGFKTPSYKKPVAPVVPPVVEVTEIVETEECAPEPVEETVEVIEEEIEGYEPGSATVQRARRAVVAAREAELPQRLPGGMRRRLKKAPVAAYIMHGESMEPRMDLCAALTDARAMGRADRETVVVDYDGEWPVVVRRYGRDGRTIYKVEDALRRQGIDVPKEDAG